MDADELLFKNLTADSRRFTQIPVFMPVGHALAILAEKLLARFSISFRSFAGTPWKRRLPEEIPQSTDRAGRHR